MDVYAFGRIVVVLVIIGLAELRVTVETVWRSRRNAMKKIERAEADLAFARKTV